MSASDKLFQGRRLGGMLLTMGFLLVLTGQAQAFWPFSTGREKPEVPVALPAPPPDANNLIQGVRQMAADLIRSLADPDPQQGDLAEGLVVCTFTDLAKLTRTSSMGRLLAEQLLSEFAEKHFMVVDIRKSSSITILEKRGEYGLSRAPEEINPALSVGAMLTGTYQVAGEHVVVNARIMDNRNAVVLASASMVLPLKGVGERLLADAASRSDVKNEVLYKKRLEL